MNELFCTWLSFDTLVCCNVEYCVLMKAKQKHGVVKQNYDEMKTQLQQV